MSHQLIVGDEGAVVVLMMVLSTPQTTFNEATVHRYLTWRDRILSTYTMLTVTRPI
jgi:hypothetical protein